MLDGTEHFLSAAASRRFSDRAMLYTAIYAEGAAGEVFGIMGSMGFLEIAASRGNAAQITGAGKGNEVSIILGEGAAAGKSA